MRICSCEKPVYVLSPYSGEIIATPCGSCDSCRNQRAKRWIDRLSQECKQHKYSYMVNLTYDDESLPKLMFCEEDVDYLEFVNRNAERIPLEELVDLCKDEYGEYLEEDLKYLRERLAHPLGLPCIFTKDISNFFKRFNKYCFSHVTFHYENLRYFCCHEYGPSTYRCHSHMLVWFDDDAIASRFQEILHACWQFGDCSASALYSDGGKSYVAQYVNMSCHLPAFYKHSRLRQRTQFSKCPSIGSFDLLDEEVRGLYNRIPTKRSVFDSRLAKYVTLPVSSSVKSRFFPKLQRYSELSYFDRVALYGCCFSVPSRTFEEFKASVKDCSWLRLREISNNVETRIADYYKDLQVLSRDEEAFENALHRWYAVSHRICTFASCLSLSINYIVSRIDEFYKKLDYENLVDFYQWQQEYCNIHPASELVAAYPEFYWYYLHYVRKSDFKTSDYVNYALKSFGICDDDDFVRLEETHDFKSMKESSSKIYKDTHKAHSVNEYVYSKRFRDSDPLLQKIIINYKKWHKEI